jgi:hypothetical protein
MLKAILRIVYGDDSQMEKELSYSDFRKKLAKNGSVGYYSIDELEKRYVELGYDKHKTYQAYWEILKEKYPQYKEEYEQRVKSMIFSTDLPDVIIEKKSSNTKTSDNNQNQPQHKYETIGGIGIDVVENYCESVGNMFVILGLANIVTGILFKFI